MGMGLPQKTKKKTNKMTKIDKDKKGNTAENRKGDILTEMLNMKCLRPISVEHSISRRMIAVISTSTTVLSMIETALISYPYRSRPTFFQSIEHINIFFTNRDFLLFEKFPSHLFHY